MIKVEKSRDGISLICVKTTRLTAANATEFKESVVKLIDEGHQRLVIDLAEVTFVDSSGLGAMVGVLKRIGNRGEIALCGAQDSVVKMFAVTRMNRVFVTFKTKADAVEALQERV